MVNEKRIIDQFLQLVQIDSETSKERKIADYLIHVMESIGLDVIEDKSNDKSRHEAGNLICKLEGNSSDTETIFFTAHMDTVAPGKSIKPVIRENMILSDGTTILGADDKAGIAAIIECIHVLKEMETSHGDLYFVIMSGEESGLVGSRYFDSSLLPADYGYALDSNGQVGQVMTAAPAQSKLYASIKGKAAHAGVNPEKGVSAISITAKAITKMPLGRVDEETTANIGSFEGKGPTNVVCDEVLLIAEARSLSENKLKKQVHNMIEALEHTATIMGGEVEVNVKSMYPSYHFKSNDKVVETVVNAIAGIGRKPILKTSGGGSDANHLSGKGIPTVNLAIGYENIHTKNERMPIQELVKIPELMVEIIKQTRID
ncbi:M20/M25/M40 family metallo-hydrolase [Gracilibacillus sp. YIM 98692]|uniref:M20/M25/M40 family metallo-hydrolase n=1 Tax=Gracilibacillus sp. YIM 98692 TaxID=2663532 RepID=UPI0013D89734|nr:M20/M25/M40 family metallo-hydrolase [Gracilibacillus sp. YIM 98692]